MSERRMPGTLRACGLLAGCAASMCVAAPAIAANSKAPSSDSPTNALIAAGASMVVAVITGGIAIYTAWKQRGHDSAVADLERKFGLDKARTESELRIAEADSNRRNEELARKRLLLEFVDSEVRGADERIRWIAARARSGQLVSELGNNRDEFKRTIYALMAPVALADLVGNVDAGADRLVARKAALATCLSSLLGADEELAKALGLPYTPGRQLTSKTEKLKANFRICDKQGVELLHELVANFKDAGRTPPIQAGDVFLKQFSKDGFDKKIGSIGSLVRDFHPREKPVFWAILIAYAYLAHAFEAVAKIDDLPAWMAGYMLEAASYDPSDGGPPAPELFELPATQSRMWLSAKLK